MSVRSLRVALAHLPPLAATAALVALAAGGCEDWVARDPGERLWRRLCAECHGLDASGNTPRQMGNAWADLRDDTWRHFSGEDEGIESAIREGIFGEMPAHDELTREEVRALVGHLRRLRGEAWE